MSLKEYRRKRKFDQTPEPSGRTRRSRNQGELRFVVQKHRATRMHHDFRLEMDGVLRSWAVPKGPSLNPLDQRLAVYVEDHPIEYGSFEGIIPRGNYGAGTVMLWDRGTYRERNSSTRAESEAAMRAGLEKGHLTFLLEGEKLQGEFALIRLKRGGEDRNWLLVKKRDEFASYKRVPPAPDRSVVSGRTMEEIAASAERKGEIWIPSRSRAPREEKPAANRVPARSAPKRPPKKASPSPPVPRAGTRAIPRRVAPMLPVHAKASEGQAGWVYEPYFGTNRAIAEVDRGSVKLYSRQFLPFEKKFPEIAGELRTLKTGFVLDGEIADGCYRILDVLYADGEDLRARPLRERLVRLETLKLKGARIGDTQRSSELASALRAAERARASAVLGRDLAAPYRSGVSTTWQKIAVPTRGGSLRPATRFAAPSSPAPRAAAAPSPARRVAAASLPASVPRPASAIARAPASHQAAPAEGVPTLTNLDKIYFPKSRITKGNLIDYYRSVAPELLPHLIDRPESMHRHPNGIARPGFFQKDLTGYRPRWLKTERVYSESVGKTIDFLLCQDTRSLEYMANLGCIELNPWLSRAGRLDRPDYSVIDLDPDDTNDFKDVIAVAREVHRWLEQMGFESVCKTSGATGLHIAIPLGARHDYDASRALAYAICEKVHEKMPEVTSLERNPQRRRGKIYLDFLQNRRGQTLAAPYCVRPREGAPVSTPLKWSEVKPGLDPTSFTIQNTRRRLDRLGDLWKPVMGPSVPLAQGLKILGKKAKRT